MKYLYLLYADESQAPAADSPEMQELLGAYGKYFEEISGAGILRGGDPIQNSSTAHTLRNRNGKVEKTSGPHSPGGEQVIGYYIVETDSEEQAHDFAARVPAAYHGAVEVRPILNQA